MKTKKWVISLGGSRIIPEEVDNEFLKSFKKLLLSYRNHKFIVVTGGGKTARKYINSLCSFGKNTKEQSEIGIEITRFHANFLMKIFSPHSNSELPYSLTKLKNLFRKNQIVFCGALRKNKKQTTDATASRIAAEFKCPFINITNVKGLYTEDPKKKKDAKLIQRISQNDFYKITSKIKYRAGQNFILDQRSAKIIKRKKIPTYIVGSISEIKKILNEKEFIGTLIEK